MLQINGGILLILLIRHLPTCRSARLKVLTGTAIRRDYNSIFVSGDEVVALCTRMCQC